MADIKIYTARWSADCDQAKEFLDDEGIFYEEIDIDKTPGKVQLETATERVGAARPGRLKSTARPDTHRLPTVRRNRIAHTACRN